MVALGQGEAQAGQGWLLAAQGELERARDRILGNFEDPAPVAVVALADAVACLGAYRCFASRSLEEQLLPEAQALIRDLARRVGRGVLHADALMSEDCDPVDIAAGLEQVRACVAEDAEDSLERSMAQQLADADVDEQRRRLRKLRRLLPDLAALGTSSGVFASGDPGILKRVRGLTGNADGGPLASGDLLLVLGFLILGVTLVGGTALGAAALCSLSCNGAIAPLFLVALGIAVGTAISVRVIREARHRRREQPRGRYLLRAGHWTHTLLVALDEGGSVQVVRDKSRPPRSSKVRLHLPNQGVDAILARCGDGDPFVVPDPYEFPVWAGRLSLTLNARSGLARSAVFLIPQAG